MSAAQNKLAAAFAAHQRGDLATAEKQYRALLRVEGRHPDLLYLMGMLCLDTDRAEMAEGFLERAVKAAQAHDRLVDPGWLLALGTARQRCDDSEKALSAYEEALARNPNLIDAMFCRATALQDLERNDEAIEAYRTLLNHEPKHAEAACNFGILLRDAGKPENARLALLKAVQLKPDYAEAYAALAPVLEDLGWREDAIEVYRKAAELSPDDLAIVAGYSRSLMQSNMVREAEEVLRPMLELNPDSLRLVGQYASLRLFQGDRKGAAEAARRSLSISTDFPSAHMVLAETESGGDHEAPIAAIKDALKLQEPNTEGASTLEFAWARRLEKLTRYEESFPHYEKACAARKAVLEGRGVGYRREAEEAFASAIEEFFTADCFSGPTGSDSEKPVFVVGMPRSGTTLTEQIIGSHPQAAGAGELIAIGNAAKRLAEIQGFPKQMPTETALQRLAGRYLERLAAVDADAIRVVDKMPGNFRHLGLIAMMFPNARIVHCRRHPVDNCLSCFFQNFGADGLSWSFDLKDLAHQYKTYRRIMAHWRRALPIEILDFDYEATVADLECQARRLIDFVGLPWDDACLEFHKSRQAVVTASHSQVRQPIYSSSVGRWKRYGPGVEPLVEALAECLDEGPMVGGAN